MHIAIAGNIGSGKTTLTRLLADHYKWKPQYEAVKENPYLEDYYTDIRRWSFPMEVFFLKERFKDMLALQNAKETIVQDRSIFEGVHVFVRNNYEQANMSDRDYETFMELFDQVVSLITLPDLMIYLRADINHLVTNIQKRARGCEMQMQLDYLKGLNRHYEDFITKKYPGRVLTIDVNNLDYEHNAQDFNKITEKIDAILYGLFPISEITE